MKGHNAIEVAKTVLEVADVAWSAVERCHHHTHSHTDTTSFDVSHSCEEDGLRSLRSENERLKRLLEKNLMLLQSMSQSPSLLQNCPPDLHERLLAAVESGSFLKQLETLNRKSVDGNEYDCQFPFKEATDVDTETAELLVNMSLEEPSWWVWVTEDMVPGNLEERSGIDNDNYVIVSEEYVVDAVAYFMARCVVSNSKSQKMSPEELQKTLAKAFEGIGKVETLFNIWHAAQMFYVLSTWGLAVVGLYKSRSVIRLAAKGVHKTGKMVLKVL
ncbi:uncharacterized protein LOC107005102 isoform X2 [Solanum pennellii]|uniref:Uncharacterized protein LOC107005102 isoform X1 n=1 Tax=Solanum pennellii TaxID=28526 RepID=A0ABM1FMN9_SOLPN|nr:uncharacterized protein LOC107005102 isoform X1 [Solanum pennellii]XP_015059083.1 uncharacterized protein LOC107005102 isoform X2 [Solanum pennellii]